MADVSDTYEEYWERRGHPWEYDGGPPKNRSWPRLFAETPNYRRIGKEALGREKFRWHFGPMFYRGRLRDDRIKVIIIGQEGAQDESLSHRAFTGGTGARMQHFLHHIGIDYSYLFLNTFVYPIYGQYDTSLRWLAQHPDSPVVQHRHEIFDYALAKTDVRLVVAVGRAAKESVVSWVTSRGGSCPLGARDVSRCSGHALDPRTRLVGVPHPGGAANGAQLSAIVRGFQAAIAKIADWIEDDPAWLPVDRGMSRDLSEPYRYRSAPIPFRDLPFGVPWRLGRGGTSSNRKDSQRSIQIFSAGGRYNAKGARLDYAYEAIGDDDGYEDEPGDLPYEPPKDHYRDYDTGPGRTLGRLLMGAGPSAAWPDFEALGLPAHPSMGTGPSYRGRARSAVALIFADQQSHDDLFTGRALTGDTGQHLQAFLTAMGLRRRYFILRVLPVDTLRVSSARVRKVVRDPRVVAVHQAIVDELFDQKRPPQLLFTMGRHALDLLGALNLPSRPHLELRPRRSSGATNQWRGQLAALRSMSYDREIASPSYSYDGHQNQIPRFDLPYGTPRWVGTSGDRASRPTDLDTGDPSYDYYKLYVPRWVHRLRPSSQ